MGLPNGYCKKHQSPPFLLARASNPFSNDFLKPPSILPSFAGSIANASVGGPSWTLLGPLTLASAFSLHPGSPNHPYPSFSPGHRIPFPTIS